MNCRLCEKPLEMTDALPGRLHFACATRLSILAQARSASPVRGGYLADEKDRWKAPAPAARKTDQERLREAMAILSEVMADARVPVPLRELAASWCQERHPARRTGTTTENS